MKVKLNSCGVPDKRTLVGEDRHGKKNRQAGAQIAEWLAAAWNGPVYDTLTGVCFYSGRARPCSGTASMASNNADAGVGEGMCAYRRRVPARGGCECIGRLYRARSMCSVPAMLTRGPQRLPLCDMFEPFCESPMAVNTAWRVTLRHEGSRGRSLVL